MNKISELTRRNIFDYIQAENINWCGRLDEIDFLSRIFDLDSLPSSDGRFNSVSGDIWQHRINNPQDWQDYWVFTDKRFNLLKCDDSILLRFLCEMIHPIVRLDSSEVTRLIQIFNENLKEDDYEIVEKTKISGKPVFAGRQRITGQESIHRKNKQLIEKFNAEYISQQINLMESAIENAPHVAIGTAKELIESCCKNILHERGKEINKSWNLLELSRETYKELQLLPMDVPEERKASKTIKSILGSLTMVVQGISELRNDYGSGHGKKAEFQGLNPRHAKLAVGAATTLAIFLLETHEIRK